MGIPAVLCLTDLDRVRFRNLYTEEESCRIGGMESTVGEVWLTQ